MFQLPVNLETIKYKFKFISTPTLYYLDIIEFTIRFYWLFRFILIVHWQAPELRKFTEIP